MFRLSNCLLSLTLLLLAGCLEFDGQEVTMRYDAKADRIDMLVVYRGVFYEAGSDGSDMTKAFKDYDEVMAKGTSFFWSNWPLEVDLTKTGTPLAPLGAHVYVENGGMFTDPTGRLDGYQFVRIRDAKEFLAKLNTMLELAVQAAMLGGFRGVKFDRDTKEFVREFLRDKQKMVTVEAGRIQLRLPCSAADFKKMLGKLEDYFVTNAAGEMTRRVAVGLRREVDPEDSSTIEGAEVLLNRQGVNDGMKKSPSFRFFWDNEITIERTEELQTIGIGAVSNRQLQITKASSGYYTDNFLKAARERGDKVEDGVPDQEIVRRFEDFLTREAVLPPELAPLRKQ